MTFISDSNIQLTVIKLRIYTPYSNRRPTYADTNYIRLTAFDNSHGWESIKLSFIVNRPKSEEPGFRLQRQEVDGRNIRYTTQAYSTDKPSSERYKG